MLALGLSSSSPPLFDSDSLIDVALRGPLTELLDDEDSSAYSFLLAHDGVVHPVQAQAYGKSRRRVCSFPSLLVQFESAPATTTGVGPDRLAGLDFLRFTNQCKSASRARTDLIEEYLAYRIINLLTDVSYRVRLLRVDHIDVQAGHNYVEPLLSFFHLRARRWRR